MSYINEALRRLQKEKGSPYAAYSHIVGAEGKKPRRYSPWMSFFGILIVVSFAAGVIVFLNHLKIGDVRSVSYSAPPPAPEKTKTADRQPNEAEPSAVMPAVKKPTGDAQALYAQALAKHRAGRLVEAKKLYRRVIELDARNLPALNNLGVIYLGEGNYSKAIGYFQQALNINGRYADAHYNLACAYARKNDKDRSLFYLKNAIDFNPEARQWAKTDEDLKALRQWPEFIKLTEEAGN